MNKKYLSAGFCCLFLAAALPCLSIADPTPVPSPANGDSALIAKINGLYYNYKNLGLHKFKCEVKISMFDNVLGMLLSKFGADDSRYKAMKDVRFFMNYDEKTGMNFNYSNYKPTGDSKIDTGMAKILDGASKIVDGFWKEWKEMVFEPAIDPVKSTVTVKKTDSGYEIQEKKDAGVGTNILDKDLLITEVDARKTDSPDIAMTIKPVFIPTANGLLLVSASVNAPKIMDESITVDYADTAKYKMPSKAVISVDMMGNLKTDVTLQFSNYQLN